MICRAGKHKIVDVHDEEEVKSGVPEATPPWVAIHEPYRTEMCLTMLLPASSRVRVAVKCHKKGADKVVHAFPGLRQLFARQPDPCGGTGQPGLNVGLDRVGLLHGVTRH